MKLFVETVCLVVAFKTDISCFKGYNSWSSWSSYVKQESPKGELGLYLVSDNTNKPMAILVSLFNFWKISNHYFVSDKGYWCAKIHKIIKKMAL